MFKYTLSLSLAQEEVISVQALPLMGYLKER
jgi:hypothetical protein